ncbi:uncharacterized protein LOC142584805 [Dermacentor variabilis]|uniref:uncharacterized protein LOC142584805 n=1 Tax=Dermacentor variabilis TaxID=34621 RepID=UPI003F5B2871
MATSGASADGNLTRMTAEETEAYFAWVEYVQSVAESADMEEKVRSAVDKTKALRRKYTCEIAEALKEEKHLKAQIAYSKAVVTNKDDLVTLNTHGDIGDLRDEFAEQSKKYLDAGVVVIRDAKPVNREKLGSSLSAMAAKGGELKHLPLADASEARMKFVKGVKVGAQELSRISSLKKEITESCKALEFLKAVQDVCQDTTSDSKYNTVLDLESLNLSP